MGDRAADQDPGSASRERQEALRRFFALSTADQLRAYREIKEYLAGELGEGEDEYDVAIARRASALEALERVAGDLRERGELAGAEAPTVQQFDKAAKRLGLEWGRSRVIRAFGSWRNAQAALLGEHVLESEAQRDVRRGSGRRTYAHEKPIEALREWLASNPRSKTKEDYDAFAQARNAAADPGAPLLPKHRAVRTALELSWSECVDVAAGKLDLADTLADQRQQLLSGLSHGDLVGPGAVAALFGWPARNLADRIRAQPDFPRPVATLGKTRAWLLGDLELYRDGLSVPGRREGDYQERILGGRGVAEMLGINQDYLHADIRVQAWNRVPEPAGKVGIYHYWWREEVEEWLAPRPSAYLGLARRWHSEQAGGSLVAISATT